MRRILIGVAILITAIAFLHVEENWRGNRRWNNYRKELEARGAQLEFAAFLPKPIPDEQNFAATPMLTKWFQKQGGQRVEDRLNDNHEKASGMVRTKQTETRQLVDLVAWEMAFVAIKNGNTNPSTRFGSGKLDLESRRKAAPAVLEALKDDEAIFEELRQASKRRFSQYAIKVDPENPWSTQLPHLAAMKAICHRLMLKACAELAAGQKDDAFADVQLMFRIADSFKEEPFLISWLVHLACFNIALHPVWEGLVEHQWTDAQLQQLQAQLGTYDFAAEIRKPLQGERALGLTGIAAIANGKYDLMDFMQKGDRNEAARLANRLVPRGWYSLEQYNYCRLHQIQSDGTIDVEGKRVWPARVKEKSRELEREFGGGRLGRPLGAFVHHHIFASLLLPALDKITMKGALAQTTCDEAVIACALERYRRSKGTFPDKLQALTPEYIREMPHDMITGEPLKYERTNDSFILYSVGWNERDDGGQTQTTTNETSRRVTEDEGDWVWRYPDHQ